MPTALALAVTVGGLLVGAGCGAAHPRSGNALTVQGIPPLGADSVAGVAWMRVPGPGGSILTAAVARPPGSGPRGVVVILHGTHGFAREYVTLARDLAREAGVVAVAACWFAGRRGASTAVVTPIECPDAPPMPDSSNTPAALAIVGAVVEAARALPDVRADRVALLGHSRGAVAALYFALERGGALRAIVLNDGAYPPSLTARATELRVPLLLMHGTEDAAPGRPPDGGSEMTRVDRARTFEAAVRAAGTTEVTTEYFAGANHVGLFTSAAQRARSLDLVSAFLRAHDVR